MPFGQSLVRSMSFGQSLVRSVLFDSRSSLMPNLACFKVNEHAERTIDNPGSEHQSWPRSINPGPEINLGLGASIMAVRSP